MSKPSVEDLRWSSVSGTHEPFTARKQSGWVHSERFRVGWWNWWARAVWRWFTWVDDSFGENGIKEALAAEWYGNGSDGDVTISSGTTTLSRDMHYANLTISGTGSISIAGWRLFVSTLLTLTNAPANAITFNGSGSGSAPSGSVGAGMAGTVYDGTSGPHSITETHYFGGQGGASGTNADGGPGTTAAPVYLPWGRPSVDFMHNGGLIAGGGGGAIGLTGTTAGAGGQGGGCIIIAARTIARSSSTTTAGCIKANGANGSAGVASGVTVNGGSGGGGGGGGFVAIIFESLTGTAKTGAIVCNGGTGGNGGTDTGTGGQGGTGGAGGRVALYDMSAGTVTRFNGSAGTTGSAPSGASGGAGGAAGTLSADL